MHRVALVGGQGCGKTTLAMALCAHMKDEGLDWHYVSEYAREFFAQNGANSTGAAGAFLQSHFAQQQSRNEQLVPPGAAGFVTDSPLFLGWAYTCRYTQESGDIGVIARNAAYDLFQRSVKSYTMIVQLKREKAYLTDGVRAQSLQDSIDLDKTLASMLNMHGVSVLHVSGSTADRIEQIKSNLSYPG